jgi:hypothetical protein
MEAKDINTEVNAEVNTPTSELTGNAEPTQMNIPETLNQQQALQVLVDAARVAQSKGIFTLDDAELVNKAIRAFMPPAGPVPSQV